jgi:hypothetical protein
VCVCVCVFWIANIVQWFSVGIESGYDRSICTDSPSCLPIRPVKLRTGCESNRSPTWHLGPPRTGCIQNAKRNFSSEFPATEQVHITKCFPGTASYSDGLSPSDFYLWGQLKILVCSARMKMKKLFQRVLYARQNVHNHLGTFERVPMRI